jgi:hypothetical protein
MGKAPENPQPDDFRMKDLFIDVRLEACVNGSTFDFLGKKLFSAEFFREGLGFGITSIDVEINTSLQPIVTIVFKDLYGGTIFGGQDRNPDESGQSIDYSVIFNWPPPKFLFAFKGYLGKPTTWLLNLKRTSTSFNSSDGSYDLKCEFVPNQWGFFADMPFLYLLAAKRLRKDRLGGTEADTETVTSVFDLIKIGKQVEIKTQDTTKEFDDLVKQLGSMKSNIGRAMVVSDSVEMGNTILGIASNQPVTGWVPIKVPSEEDLEKTIGDRITIEQMLGQPSSLNAVNAYLLLSLGWTISKKSQDGFKRFGNQDGAQIPSTWPAFLKDYRDTGSDARLRIDAAKQEVLNMIQGNLDLIDDEIKRRVFATSEKKLEKITISEIFSQLAKDAAFVMGSILDAGLDGYRGEEARKNRRDELSEKIIGQSFPLVLGEDGEELPATKENLGEDIGVDTHEMKFVDNFINAVSEGIAKDLLSNNPQSGEEDSKLKQRINNMEMSSGNPYKSYYTNIATNILVRGGIVGYMTRSNDPNLPGDYGLLVWDRDDIADIQELAKRDMQNVTENILKNLSDVDFLLLKRFCTFFVNFFTADAEYFAGPDGKEASPITGGETRSFVDTWKVVMKSKENLSEGNTTFNNALVQVASKSQNLSKGIETTTFGEIWGELWNPKSLENVKAVEGNLVFNTIEEEESTREDQIEAVTDLIGNIFGGSSAFSSALNTNAVLGKQADNPLSFVTEKNTNGGTSYWAL